ncbi:MAG: hypothetical protein AAGE52_21075 [Myxococcota bacterium]
MSELKFKRHTKDVRIEVKTSGPRPRAPIAAASSPPHPALAHAAPSTMHDDGASTDTSPFAGPLGGNGSTRTWLERKRSAAGLCPAFVFFGSTTFTVSFSFRENSLVALDSDLNVIDTLEVPRRSIDWSRLFSGGLSIEAITRRLFRDTSGGAYFFVEDDGRVVIPTSANTMWRIKLEGGKLTKEKPFDFNPEDGGPYGGKRLPSPAFGNAVCADEGVCIDYAAQHRVISALPTWGDEDSYWFATNLGVVGVLVAPPNSKAVTLDLNNKADNPWARSQQDERIQNSFSVGAKGAFVVSDYALYRFVYDGDQIRIAWRVAVPRTVRKGPKPGHVGMGSGTTPTLIRDDYVAITDAGEQMKVILCTQDTHADHKPKVSTHIAFDGAIESACENSLVSFGNHLILGNTWGYITPFEKKKRKDGVLGVEGYEIVGGGKLKKRWDSPVNVMSAPPKLGRKNATLYAYTQNDEKDWALVGMDPWSGDVVYRGVVYDDDDRDNDNAWGTIGIGPEDQLFVAQWSGLLRITDD